MYFTGQSSSPSICTDRKRENSNIFTRKKYIAQGIESLHTTLTRVDGAILASLKRFVWHSKTSISTCLRGLFCRCPNSSFASSAGKQITLTMSYEIKTCNKMMYSRISHDNKSQAYKVNDNILPGLWEGFHSLLGLFKLFSLLQRNKKYED